ncbi:MAG: enoyl-CoA hydratase/isomerase family protein [Chloroflexi bacterium]|nr:enoyl-CoA hydratase/isomerase family protein [Chloroflexota bacterium]
MSAVLYEKKGKIAYITLNRPEALNSLNLDAWNGLIEAWIGVRDDPDIWVAIVTGTGEKAFCAGQDLKELNQWMMIPEDQRPPVPVPDITPMRGMEVWKPFIAAINGICTGGGLELALACDISIAADNARLGLAEVKQALIPGMGGTQRLPRVIPFRKALEMLMTGDFVDAQEAYRIGLVNQVVPLSELMPTAEALAQRICENGPLAVRAIKEAAYRGLGMNLSDSLRLEQEVLSKLADTEDLKEGPRAFAEKRNPVYKAR